MLVSTSPTFNV